MTLLEALPIEIARSDRAVVWNRETRDGKPTKVPYNARRPADRARVDDPSTWAPFHEAVGAVDDGKADGPGVVLGAGLIGVDLDACRDATTGVLTPEARTIVAALNSYTEISPSGRGIHILATGTLPPGRRRHGPIEMYADGRFFTVTGHHLAGTPTTIEERTTALASLHARVFTVEAPADRPRPSPTIGDEDDATLVARMHAARTGYKFSTLWAGDASGYPSASEADLALCATLAFWTGREASRMDRLFRQSGLMRAKWDTRHGRDTYGNLTIDRAIAGCRDTYQGTRSVPRDGTYADAPPPIADEPPGPDEDTAEALIAERFPAFCFRLRNATRPADIVPDLIPTALAMVHGQPRAIKTWSAQEIARATSTGTAAFGLERFTIATPRETWYLTEEDPELEVHDRFRCLFAGQATAHPDTLHVSVQKAISFDDPAWQRRVIEYAADVHIALTIVDPIRASSVAVDQGPRELKPLAAFLRTLMRVTGSGVLLVHHDVKPLAGKPDDRARPQRASGGGIFSIADAPIHAELCGETGGQTLLSPAFYKFAIAPAPFLVTLTADDPKRPTWVRLTGETTSAEMAAELVLHRKIRDYLREHPATSGTKVAAAIHANKGRTFEALEKLFAAGEADSFQRGQAKLWSMVSGVGL